MSSWLFAAVVMLGTPIDNGVVLLDFQAGYCAPCRQMAPTVDRLASDGYNVQKVDFERHKDLVNKFKVKNIPCFVILIDGREMARVTGPTSFSHLQGLLDRAASIKAAREQSAPPAAIASMPDAMPGHASGSRNLLSPPPRSEVMPATSAEPVFHGTPPSEPMVPFVSASHATGESTSPATIVPVSHLTSPAESSLPVTQENLLSCTVRIRVYDDAGRSSGTGTIIDARHGWALVLTCGHLFRDYKKGNEIEIEMFQGDKVKKVKGVFRSSNQDRDLALISFQTKDPVRIARVASKEYDAKVDQSVAGVGCSEGKDPTVMFTRVVSRNSIVGPPNIKTSGLSVEGRSGGGLFSREGLLLGVCNFAMPTDNAAVFAASESIRAELDRAGLSYVYKNPQGTLLTEPFPESDAPLVADAAAPGMPERMPATPAPAEPIDGGPLPTAAHTRAPEGAPAPVNFANFEEAARRNPGTSYPPGTGYPPGTLSAPPMTPMATPPMAPAAGGLPPAAPGRVVESLTQEEAAALAEIRRRRAAGSEVICIVRSRTNPSADTEIFVLEKASPEFFKRLAAEAATAQNAP